MSNEKLPAKSNMAEWYQEVIARAKLAEHAPVKGCMVIRPYGFAIWELIKEDLDKRFKRRGVQNACFPLFIPYSYLAREKEHVEGFSPEIAVVTHAGGQELAEPLVVRPTSETIIHESMRKWIQSYRDLPMRLNQWCNVVRWEKHPRLFLRSSEFFWQEGHTAHATEEEARREALEMLDVYYDFCENVLAIPAVKGQKSEKERFAGAEETYSFEALMPDGKALQMGTSHYLGQNFSKMANVNFIDKDEQLKHVYMTSWGVSTRMIGGLIMSHGDDLGLVLPPKVAPVQVVIVPIGDTVEVAEKIKADLMNHDIRVEVDSRSDVRPGAKFYEHELRGVPVRLEIGAKELANGVVSYAIRHSGEKGQLQIGNLVDAISALLDKIQVDMLVNAKAKLADKVIYTEDKAEFLQLIEDQKGFISAPWCDEKECELAIKQQTTANTRNLPFDEQKNLKPGCTCVYCGKKAKKIAYFAKSY